MPILFTPEFPCGECLRINPQRGTVLDARFSPDGTKILSVTADGVASIWDAISGQEIMQLNTPGLVRFARYSANLEIILVVSDNQTMSCFSARDGLLLSTFRNHDAKITSLAYFPSGKKIVSADLNGTVIVWSTETANENFRLRGHEGYEVGSVAVSHDEAKIITTSARQRSCVVWNAETGKPVAYCAELGEKLPSAAIFSPDNDRIVLFSKYGSTEILEIGTWQGHFGVPEALLSPEILWDRDMTESIPYLNVVGEFEDDSPSSGMFSADGQRLIVSYMGSKTTIWDWKTLSVINSFCYPDQITCLTALSPNDLYILTGPGVHPQIIDNGETADSKTVSCWDSKTGNELISLQGHSDLVTNVSIDPSGLRIATASRDGTIMVWTQDVIVAALVIAAAQNRIDSVDLLLKLKDVNAQNFAGVTALNAATEGGHINLVSKLLSLGADPNIQDDEGISPLHMAAVKGHADVVEVLLDAGSKVELLAENGETPLISAACYGDVRIGNALLKNGANENHQNANGVSPLMFSASRGHKGFAELLIRSRAEIDMRDKDQTTALYYAAENNQLDTLVLLLERGASPDLASDEGASPLFIASQKGYSEVVRALLKKYADPDLRLTSNGNNALHIACAMGCQDVLDLLLQHGMDVHQVNKNASTPMYLAVLHGNTSVVKRLLSAGIDANQRFDDSSTPLIVAAHSGHTDVVKVLLSAGADPKLSMDAGVTAVQAAILKNHLDIAGILSSASDS